MFDFREPAGRALVRAAASNGAGQVGPVVQEMIVRAAVRSSGTVPQQLVQAAQPQQPPTKVVQPVRLQHRRYRRSRRPPPPRPPTLSSWRREPITRPSRKVTPNVMTNLFNIYPTLTHTVFLFARYGRAASNCLTDHVCVFL